jgi:hypothetical protein
MPPPPRPKSDKPKAGVVPKADVKKRTDGKSSSEAMETNANMAFPKSDGDGHKDEADPALIARVLAEPDVGNMNIAVVVRASLARATPHLLPLAVTWHRTMRDVAAGAGLIPLPRGGETVACRW